MPVVQHIAREEGFAINPHKSRIMHRSQRQCLAGVVVNAHPNRRRSERDQLRAILHNCRRGGIAPQNRDGHQNFAAHLRGRIAAVAMLNPEQGQRLLRIWEEIDWSA